MPATLIFRRSVTLLALGGICLLSVPASAQYFGQNKVQYRSFDFQVLRTDHFDIYFYPSERPAVDIAARMAERWKVRLEQVLRHELSGRQPLVLYASHTDFAQTNVIGGDIGEGTGGVTESIRRRIVLPLGGPLADTDHVIGHELVHAFQFDMTTRPDGGPGQNGAQQLPLWFIEGMAEYLSLGPVDSTTAMWLRDAARQEKLPSIKDLDNPKYFPYRWGHALWAYIGGRWGDDVIGALLTDAAVSGDIDGAFEKVLGIKSKELSSDWQASILKTYLPVLTKASTSSEVGNRIIQGREFGADLNVGPSISPDGRWLTFVSSRGFLSIDLYLAEASTGKIVRKLTSTATNPHFSSIQFIYSAGAWDSASRHIAVATVTGGKAAIAIIDTQSGSVTREISIPDVDEIFNPTWAPDGHAIAFSAMQGGLVDLFVYDVNTKSVKRLTHDAYAELQPDWSPDGTRIAFSTDRFTSDLSTISIGEYRLALIDPATATIEAVKGFDKGKHLNPQWSPDSRSLSFVSDRTGVSNVYRVPVSAPGEAAQLTTLATGVSGITGTSPALSVSTKTGTAAFSVYQNFGYDIFTVEPSRGGPLVDLPINAAILPPPDRKQGEVAALLAAPKDGLPEPITAEPEPYSGKLGITGVAQPVVGVGLSRFGTSFGGGLALAFSDMLGNHQLVTAFQVNSGIAGSGFSTKDIGAQVGYYNLAHRWNWGVTGGQVPYLSGGYQSSISQVGNDVLQTDQLFVFRQTERNATGAIAYPFDRAQRIEFQGGLSQISFDQTVQTQTYSLRTGRLLQDTSETTPFGETMNLGTAAMAYVFDTSTFGATSPVQGQRARLELSPTFGTLNFTGALLDYRRYFMPAPFYTLAFRVLHYGRYGSDSEDTRIFPLDIGYPWLVRGYDAGSFQFNECVANATSACPVIDNLTGSRMLVGNVEFRFPILRPFGAEHGMYGPVPVEVAFFADAGNAWNKGQTPTLFGGTRDGAASAGVAFRANLFGFAVGEFDIIRPFQRPGRGWVFGFNLMPGW